LIVAGIGDVFVTAGELVQAGGAMGLMPGIAPTDGTDLIVSDANGSGAGLTETLYIELRQGGRPVDPLEWFAQN